MSILNHDVIGLIEKNLHDYNKGIMGSKNKWHKVIEDVLKDERMDDIKEGIIKLGYFKGMKVEDLVEAIFISRRYYFEKRKEFLLLIALHALSNQCLVISGGQIAIYNKMHH